MCSPRHFCDGFYPSIFSDVISSNEQTYYQKDWSMTTINMISSSLEILLLDSNFFSQVSLHQTLGYLKFSHKVIYQSLLRPKVPFCLALVETLQEVTFRWENSSQYQFSYQYKKISSFNRREILVSHKPDNFFMLEITE